MKLGCTLLPLLIAGLSATASLSYSSPAVADVATGGPLRVAVALASARSIAPGQPIVLHYVLTDASASASAHFDIGQNNTGWYRLSLRDAGGRPAQAIPDLRPQTHPTEGLYQTGDRSLDPGGSLEGGIVVTRFFSITRPGKYLLTFHVPLDYKAETKAEDGAEGGAVPTSQRLDQSFTYPIEVTSPDPAVVRATAEALRRKLVALSPPAGDQWEPVDEELFSMPEAQALPAWQTLAGDPATPDGVRIAAANQLAYHPSLATASLLARMLWETPTASDGGSSLTQLSRSVIARALITMKDIASPDVKQRIRVLDLQHQGYSPEVRAPSN